MNLRSLLTGLALLGCSALALAGETLELTPAQIESLGLRFAAPVPATSASGSAWPGTVLLPPDGHELLIAPLPGRVVRVHASSGEKVQAGQPLLTLYSPTLVQLVQDYLRAQASEDLARQTLTREQRLVREGIGVERRLREAEIGLRQAQAESQGLAARLKLAGLDPRQTLQGKVVSELVVRAPRAGSLLLLHATPGAWLDEGAAAAELGYTERRWVEAELPLEQVTQIQPGQRAEIQPGAMAGRVLAVALTAEAQRQTVRVRIELDQGGTLRPGQRVQVRFDETGPLWRVPGSALVNLDGHEVVFVQRREGLLPRPVVLRGRSGEAALVEGPLLAEDRVVTLGAMALKAAWQAQHEAK